MTLKQRMDKKGQNRVLVAELNPMITCRLCEGYLVDATTLVDCLHVFCRACILRHFDNSKTGCPTCNSVYKKKSQTYLPSLVYKLVPSLYAKEMQRREDFYRSTGLRASSSCSDDSVIERERDMINDQEDMISTYIGDKTQFFSPDDTISLSLEYYQSYLDAADLNERRTSSTQPFSSPTRTIDVSDSDSTKNSDKTDANSADGEREDGEREDKDCDKRFLQCPAAVTMKHLQKFIRMKFGLTGDHRVDVIYKGEVLRPNFSLMDVAYTFKWERESNYKSSPIKATSDPSRSIEGNDKKPDRPEEKAKDITRIEETEDQKNHKERLFAHLQLQSKAQVEKDRKPLEKPIIKECRDREWALQKRLDETSREEDYVSHHFTKKRKKNKHSKNEFAVHKKRKLHAEIASNEEDLKLKVKITNNGHKHKHHKNSGQPSEKTQAAEISSKEKLLQMRQVRHKHVSSEDKNIQTVPSIRLSKDPTVSTDADKNNSASEDKRAKIKDGAEEAGKPSEDLAKLKIKVAEPSSKVTESAILPKQQTEDTSTSPKAGTFVEPSSSKPGFSLKNEKGWAKKNFQSYTEKYLKNEKLQQSKIESAKQVNLNASKPQEKPSPKPDCNKISTNNKNLERKIANLQQHCTIEATQPDRVEKKVTFNNDKPKILTSHYPAGFTVSKIEQGVKRKSEEDIIQDKRPSLEITLINPPASTTASAAIQPPKPGDKPAVKRPPPATIPLERIKKSVNLKSGISIIPKLPERVPKPPAKPDGPNGLSNRQLNALQRPPATVAEKVNMSNLQMLSKVATEYPALNKTAPPPTTTLNKPRLAQMPSLQSLKIPLLQNPGQMKSPNLQKLPKLNEIQKFRPTNPQIRNLRPNQNQNIRNIPNPSLLIRQQNQNRLNSQIINAQALNSGDGTKSTAQTVGAAAQPASQKEAVSLGAAMTVPEAKVQEKTEISV
ncbi:hypothetical protein NQ317_010793 [Molorchus minor]|uniref:RING-type domain-containing protein n=1 Tax=Molorchus minor TaxID=1323400 RepID=A0ABQ9J162_9CUCU|nr:hypothetical protein NQ317_010793 [Molorchus minor]